MRQQNAAQGLAGWIRGCGLRAVWGLMAVALLGASPGFSAGDKAGPVQDPPLVIRGAEVGPPVTPYIIDVDLRDLPPPRPWKPGDPIRMVPRRVFQSPGEDLPAPVEPAADPLWLLQSEIESLDTLSYEPDSFTVPSRNFPGIPFTGSDPPDTVGDVGPNHYIQMVNGSEYLGHATVRIWDKAEPEPNLLASFSTADLAKSWCDYAGGDGVVLYDRQADRWLITYMARFGVCAYVSRTSDPVAGGWYSYAFDLNADMYFDYPHPAVWATDANGGAGSYIVTGNYDIPPVAFLNREAMLAGDAADVAVVRLPDRPNSSLQATTPAEPDGPNGPPAGAPGIIMRLRDTEFHDLLEVPGDFLEMWLVDVDWEDPANTTLTRAADIGVADFDASLCPDDHIYACFPQPGTATKLDALQEVVMHRLQYYRHETYESLIGNFVVDVDGMDHGGVRWFELRRESGGDWGLYQEGTYSLDGDNRWMASVASDQDGNIALGYSVTSGETYPSIRYTGRLSEDVPGFMTQPETSMVAGQYSRSSVRWGDYSAMSLDPSDDCTFWFTNEYAGEDLTWRTQIASFRFETCGCVEMPPPPALEAEVSADNRIDLSWDDSSDGTVVEYRVERSRVAGGPYEVLDVVPDSSPGIAGGPGYSFQDTDVQGGIVYYYVVVARDDDGCRSKKLNEVSATATGACTLPPVFAGLRSATSGLLETCAVDLAWDAAVPECGGPAAYNVYRSTAAGFAPGPDSLLAGGVTATSFADSTSLAAGTTYYYVVRAVDLANGLEDPNVVERAVTVAGPGTVSQTVFFADFEAADSLAAWTAVNAVYHECGDWRRTDDPEWQPPDSSGFYVVSTSSDCTSRKSRTYTGLSSPEIDLSSAGTGLVTLGLDVLADPDTSAWIYVWDGSFWRFVKEVQGETSLSLDVTTWAAGNPGFRVRLVHSAIDNYSAFFAADNVRVTLTTGASCTTAP